MFDDMVQYICEEADNNFEEASRNISRYIDNDSNFIDILKHIGTIPESIEHDSTVEKLFSKASDAVLSRAFREIGLRSTILRSRADSADVQAKSTFHGYTLVADAKAFRMSRTAKNQKDFKVVALSGWRHDAEYAVLCAPYFQYPSNSSQIYAQAIQHNVCLLSWEHLVFLIENNIKESSNLSFSRLWGFCETYASQVSCADSKKSFIAKFNTSLAGLINISYENFASILSQQRETIKQRGKKEKYFWETEIENIKQYSRETAINELIKSKKIREKIAKIDDYITGLPS